MTSYLLQVTVCWLLFYALYWVVLSRETFFRLNRSYLICTLFLGLIIPVIQLPEWSVSETGESIGYYLEEATVTAQNLGVTLEEVVVTAETKASELSLTNIFMLFYWLGVAIFSALFLGGIWRIQRLKRYAIIQDYEEYQLVNTREVHLPFSFFRWLFWNDAHQWTEEERTAILRHELEHIRGYHSWDVLFLEILKIFFWFCPAIYLYKRSARNVHEYLADSAVLQNTRKKQYGRLLLRQVQHQTQPVLANHLIHSQLKKRIKMMIRNKSRRLSLYKYAFLLPISALLLMAFSSKQPLTNNIMNNNFFSIIADDQPGFDKEKVRQKLNATLDKYQPKNSEVELEKMYKELTDIYFSLQKDYPDHKDDVRTITRQFFKDNKLPFMINQRTDGDRLIVLLDAPKNNEINYDQNPTELKAFKEVDQMPRFPGCESKGLGGVELDMCAKKQLLTYIYKNIRYPLEAREKSITGTVVSRFIINAEGRIQNAEILKSIGHGCDKEVLRIVNSMNEMAEPWTAGEKDGAKVPVYFNLPVKFKLANSVTETETKDPIDDLTKNIDPIFYLNGTKVDKKAIDDLKMNDIG
ncbi:MAG: M56 family metallopeptidase, partial [Bacteroidota bacterium]